MTLIGAQKNGHRSFAKYNSSLTANFTFSLRAEIAVWAVHLVTLKHELLELQHRTRLPIFYSALCERCQKHVISFNTFFPPTEEFCSNSPNQGDGPQGGSLENPEGQLFTP